MACGICNGNRETIMDSHTDKKCISVIFTFGNNNTVRRNFQVCETCYPEIKIKIAKISHDVLSLTEREHTD